MKKNTEVEIEVTKEEVVETETTEEIEAIKKVINFNMPKISTIKLPFGSSGDEVVELNINPLISMQKYSEMMNDAISYVFTNGVYNAFLRSSVLDMVKVQYFTDIAITDVELMFNLINTTNIISEIDKRLGDAMVNKIKLDYDEAIAYHQSVLVHTSEWDSVAVEISMLLEKIIKNNDKLKNYDIGKILGAVDSLVSNKEDVISKVVELHRENENDKK